MTKSTGNVPEPEQQKKEESIQVQDAQLQISSSDDDSEEDPEPTDIGGTMDGYQPLTLLENDEGDAEFHAEPLDSPDEETTDDTSHGDNPEKETSREISVDTNLVLSAMKGVSIPGSSIPPWARELSEAEWKDIIQKTISGEKASQSKAQPCQLVSGMPSSDKT